MKWKQHACGGVLLEEESLTGKEERSVSRKLRKGQQIIGILVTPSITPYLLSSLCLLPLNNWKTVFSVTSFIKNIHRTETFMSYYYYY